MEEGANQQQKRMRVVGGEGEAVSSTRAEVK
jgi:hypothetical protein